MKAIFLFLFVIGLSGVLASSYAQDKKLNLQMRDAAVKEILTEIENQSEFSFAFDNRMIDVERKLDADFQDSGIDKILSSVFENEQVKYYIFDRYIVLVRSDNERSKTVLTVRQEIVVTGTITDENGEPLIGATVVIQGTTRGAVTDLNGNYKITVPDENTVLVFSYVGYESRDITVGSQTTIDVILISEITAIEELVVIGYGTQRKTDVTGAVSTVRVADMQKIAVSNSSVALQGQVAGVNVVQSNADPSSGADIRIRGIGTLNNHFPLVIVDGVPSDINAVDPRDIESVNVLKDAASAAIYGSRAANGVIIITTNRGTGGVSGRTQVDYRAYFSVNNRIKDFGLINNSPDFIKVAKQAADNSGSAYPLFVTEYDNDPSQFGSTDWEDAIFRSAFEQKHELSVARNEENYNFYIATAYKDEEGIRLGSDDKQFSLRINSDYQVSKRLKIGQSFGYTQNKGYYIQNTYFFWSLLQTNPLQKIYDSNTPSGYGERLMDLGFKNSANPVQDFEQNDRNYKNDVILASAYLEFEPVKNLKYLFRISQNYSRNTGYMFSPSYYTDDDDYNLQNSVYDEYGNGIHNIMDHILTYNIDAGGHAFGAMFGFSRENNKYEWFSAAGKETSSNSITHVGATTVDKSNDGGAQEYKLLSLFGRLSYSYDDKYLLQANVRRDGSSRFAKENRWGWFPSVSLGWRVSEEAFFESAKAVMNSFKIRGSYGALGMQEVGNYTYIPTITSDHSGLTNYPFGTGPSQPIFVGARQVSFPSVDLTWEKTQSTNIGFDMGFLGNKLTFEGDYYIKNVNDILYPVPIPYSTGSTSSPPVNSASTRNNGFELLSGWRSYTKDFKYNINLTFAANTNEVTKLGNIGTEAIVGGSVYWALNGVTRTEVGTMLGEYYLFETGGLFKTQNEIDSYTGPTGSLIMPDAVLGDLKIIDSNNDGIIDDSDKIFMGSGMPKTEWSLTFNSSYKNFDMNLFFHAALGVKKYNGAYWMAMIAHEYHGWHEDMLNSWTPQNTNTDIPRIVTDAAHYNTRECDIYLENASYLRLSHLELGYTLPKNPVSKIGLSNIRIYLAGSNLFTITKYRGWDPSITGGSVSHIPGADRVQYRGAEILIEGADNSYASGIDRYPYPVARKLMAGIQVSF
ncbi:MAG: TonB-dependent receptor [Bacteroidales bacterium]|nr:TonB-dependent receptor [Bacteroidales bacterium]